MPKIAKEVQKRIKKAERAAIKVARKGTKRKKRIHVEGEEPRVVYPKTQYIDDVNQGCVFFDGRLYWGLYVDKTRDPAPVRNICWNKEEWDKRLVEMAKPRKKETEPEQIKEIKDEKRHKRNTSRNKKKVRSRNRQAARPVTRHKKSR